MTADHAIANKQRRAPDDPCTRPRSHRRDDPRKQPRARNGRCPFGADAFDVIEHATTPGPNATHAPAYFSRDREHTEAESARLYRLDGSRWIGEWHTHPGAELVPSEVDLTTYVRHLKDPELRFDRFFALICSAREPIQVAAWRIRIISRQVTVDSPRLEVDPLE